MPIYEMSSNKTLRSTVAYLIVRDQAHENAYAKALETLGVDCGRTLPIPKTDAERYPEVQSLLEQGLATTKYTFSVEDLSEAGKIFRGAAPATVDGATLSTEQIPAVFPRDIPWSDRRSSHLG
ncbi:MAG: manganese catalase family protein [Geodermatophilaceae bacterium]